MTIDNQSWHAIFQPMVQVHNGMQSEVNEYEMLLRDSQDHFPGTEFLDGILTKEGNLKWIDAVTPGLKKLLTASANSRVFINLDPAQLNFDEVWDFLKETRAKYGDRVAVEITERRQLIPDIQYFYHEFHELKKMGFEIAIDDVSSGGNSYEFVCHHLTDINRIKLSLLTFKHSVEKTTMQFAKAWLDFAQENNLSFVLEGVESQEMAQSFAGRPNVLQQGFYWDKQVQ